MGAVFIGQSMKTLEENVTIDEGVNVLGVREQYHFQGDSLIIQKTWDAEPYLQHAEQERQASEGQGWGDGKKVFHLPPVEYGKFIKETKGKSPQEKSAWLRRWALDNPALVHYTPYLKGLRAK